MVDWVCRVRQEKRENPKKGWGETFDGGARRSRGRSLLGRNSRGGSRHLKKKF